MKLLKYRSLVPVSGLVIYSVVLLLENFGIIPDPRLSLQSFAAAYAEYSFIFMFLIILIESIAYMGFYFPGQLFAVLIVIVNDFTWLNVLWLTLVSILAVTISAAINYRIGMLLPAKKRDFSLKELLVAMLHINLLALYMVELGASRAKKTAILYAGLLNIPYYILLIAGTFLIREQIQLVAEDSYFLLGLLALWAGISVIIDLRTRKKQHRK